MCNISTAVPNQSSYRQGRSVSYLIVQNFDTVLPLKGLDDGGHRLLHASERTHIVDYQQAAHFEQAERQNGVC